MVRCRESRIRQFLAAYSKLWLFCGGSQSLLVFLPIRPTAASSGRGAAGGRRGRHQCGHLHATVVSAEEQARLRVLSAHD